MEPDFWHQRWTENQIGFHQREFNAYLRRFWAQLDLPPGSRVFVPLCGKSRDMLWLAEAGHTVTGVEISPLAVEHFFREAGLQPTVRETATFRVYESGAIRVFCGDYFDMRPDFLDDVRGVFDRAALIALPEDLRRSYVARLQELLPARPPILLVTLEYPQDRMSGPPFSVARAEVEDLFQPGYRVDALQREDMLDDNPRFRERGLDRLWETAYLLRAGD